VQQFHCTTYPRKVGVTESPAGATLPEVAKFPLQNSVRERPPAPKPVVKDTKLKGFSP
jgi:hypothetical protein